MKPCALVTTFLIDVCFKWLGIMHVTTMKNGQTFRPIFYASKSLNYLEQNYMIME